MAAMVQGAGTAITHRRVLGIALPIVLSNATVPILGAVDTGVVGQLGAAAPIGAVGIATVILSSVYWIFGFLRMGTSGLVAQAHGAGDHTEVSVTLMRALLIAGAAGLALILLQMPLFAAAFHIAPASAEVEGLARSYLAIRIWGAPLTIALYALTGWLIALERTQAVLVLQLTMNAVNVALDLVFVLQLGWGVEGVASATLIAEIIGAAIGFWCVRDAFGPMRALGAAVVARIFDRAKLIRMAQINGDIMIRSVLLQLSFTSFMFLAARQGDVQLAANQVLLQFLMITSFALDGFAFATESLVGQAFGAKSIVQLRRAAWVPAQWGIGAALILGVVFALAGPQTIALMASDPQVQDSARRYLPWLVAAPLLSVASYMLDGVFIGATLTREMRNAMLVCVGIYGVAVYVLPMFWGNHGLWAALMVLNAVRGLAMGWLYPRVEAAARAAGQ
ncbi:MATE family efflux transporter [Thioclava sp. SK-1]|uniref:MATE family efflux transporter n=1 Tax=Thioclava sp. SK-1 TaxID=1889770 RepID=UPI000825638C|nr:MATE family efflux transporter [Thioclava sp. SK-1]OCX66734.1 MATE family efflux transporter [Thioclava sp. SK-1]